MYWLHPPLLHQLVWDSSYEESSSLTNLKALLTQSLAAPLLPAQQQEVCSWSTETMLAAALHLLPVIAPQ